MTARRLDHTVAAVLVHAGTVLFMQRKPRGMWLFPAGHVEPNETPDAALVREVREETGLEIRFLHTSPPPAPKDVLEHLHLPIFTNKQAIGDHDHYCQYFLCSPLVAEDATGVEGQKLAWLSAAEVREEKRIPQHARLIALWALQQHHTRKPL